MPIFKYMIGGRGILGDFEKCVGGYGAVTVFPGTL